MLSQSLKTAWRQLARNKAFSLINILGLALGMACSLLIFLWVKDESSVDTFNTKATIYDVYERVFSEGKVEAGPNTPGPLAEELKRKIPEIKFASGYVNRGEETVLSVGDKRIALNGCHADSDFFKLFSYPLLAGSAASALLGPADIAVSRKTAELFFGSAAAAYGQTIRLNNSKDFKITAVFENVPANASQHFEFVANWADVLQNISWLKEWIYRTPYTYIQLRPGADAKRVEAKIKDFITPYIRTGDGQGYRLELGLQRFDEMYLNGVFRNGAPDGGRSDYVRLFSLVAIFILLIACINFMNLATARGIKRAKEVGIRKTIGARRVRLIGQFIGEAMLLTFIAVVIALGLVALLLPAFNQLSGKQIVLPIASPFFWLAIVGLMVVTGFVAGSYPALFLSSLNPVKVLKGALRFGPGALLMRKGLVVFQFVLSIVMITGTIVIAQQMRYVQTKNLGFDRENLVYIPFQGDLGNKFQLFRQQLVGMPGIKGVTMNTNAPSRISTHVYNMDWEGKRPDERVVAIHNGVGYDYLDMMNIKVIRGRGFSRDFPADTAKTHFLINETLLKITDWKNPIGKRMSFFDFQGTVIGVVKDFHLKSLRDPIEPLVLYFGEKEGWGGVLVKTKSGETRQALASMESVFKQAEPQFPFRYFFSDEQYQQLYNGEATVSKLSNGFSVLAIFISCLGLLGLTLFTAEQRRKEIGVRKVIGASVGNIVTMLSKDIVQLVLLSAVIATPVAWLAMHQWLQNFAYRITIAWWIFFVAGVLALLIALATIGYQALKAALANPVRALRSE
ncbi:ABC transporter permease [Puia dinghuensis]|uniref:ABC transporter permease n=1 Tax=Puia dinghuensis TaxID=1792502 RepID=A0A8J2XRS4_9BACT|nr:ABC transporter permease [Puia dinghuensis]GGB03802.1 ABC transporter permease [Puia dinghuensis]